MKGISIQEQEQEAITDKKEKQCRTNIDFNCK